MQRACISRKVIPLFVQGISQVFHLGGFQGDDNLSLGTDYFIFAENSKVLFRGVCQANGSKPPTDSNGGGGSHESRGSASEGNVRLIPDFTSGRIVSPIVT